MKKITGVMQYQVVADEAAYTAEERARAMQRFMEWLESLKGKATINPSLIFEITYSDNTIEKFDPFERAEYK